MPIGSLDGLIFFLALHGHLNCYQANTQSIWHARPFASLF